MEMLALKGTDPLCIRARVKAFLAQRLEACGRKLDLVNPPEDVARLLPLRMRYRGQAGIALDKGVDAHRPLPDPRPQGMTLGRNGSHDRADPLFLKIVRHMKSGFVERSRGDFEQIGISLPADDPVRTSI